MKTLQTIEHVAEGYLDGYPTERVGVEDYVILSSGERYM